MMQHGAWRPAAWVVLAFAGLVGPGGGGPALADRGAAEAPPDTAGSAEQRIRGLVTAGRWREALAAAQDRAATTAADPRLGSLLGELFFRAGRFEEAAAVLDLLVGAGQATARGTMTLGRVRDAEGRTAEAIALMRAAVAADPEDREVLYRAAEATETRREAIDLLERYLARSAGDDPDRIEAARGTADFYRALGDRPVWLDVERPASFELPLRPVFEPDDGVVSGHVVEARLGGETKPVPLLLDSGSPGLFVIARIARKRGFSPIAEHTVFGGGGDRRHETVRGFFERLALGELTYSDVLASSARTELHPTGRWHGIIGLSAFNGYELTLDLERGRIVLGPPGVARGERYWNVAGQWLVRARVGEHGEEGLFLLDTGATRTLVSLDWVRGLPEATLGSPVAVAGFGGNLEDARELSGVSVAFQDAVTPAGEPLRAVDLSLRSKMGGVEIAGCLGLDVLSREPLVIDTVAQRVLVLARPRPTGGSSSTNP